MPNPSPANNGRILLARVRMHPWYLKPTIKNQRGLSAVLARLRGDVLPGDDKKFMTEGFLTRELGPMGLMGSGKEEVEEGVSKFKKETGGGCPFVRMSIREDVRVGQSVKELRNGIAGAIGFETSVE